MTPSTGVLVVDDSPLMQRIISGLLENDPRIRVVGTAADGYQALDQVQKLHPDVITLDLAMPRLDGLETLQLLMLQAPTPVVVLSGHDDAAAAVQALQLGAVEFVAKPSGTVSVDLYRVRDELISKVKLASLAKLERMTPRARLPASPPPSPEWRSPSSHVLVAIGASTGGPRAVDWILRQLPSGLPATLLIVQHMPAGFTAGFAGRLNLHSPMQVKEASDKEVIQLGTAYIAAGGRHMVAKKEKDEVLIRLEDTPAVNSVRPSVDILMTSVAETAIASSIGIVLTGMGKDGSEGLASIKAAEGMTIAQNRESSIVFGMPRAAIEQGVVDQVLPLSEIPAAIIQAVEIKSNHG